MSKMRAIGGGMALVVAESLALGNTSGFDHTIGRVEVYNYDERHADEIEEPIAPPEVTYFEIDAFAVARTRGRLPIEGRFFENRTGPVDCDFTLRLELPYVAETIMRLGNVAVETQAPDANGQYDVVATASGGFEVFNPRVTLDDASQEFNGDLGVCPKDAPTRLINNLWRVGQAAVNTSAECLVASLSGNPEASELRALYEDGLRTGIQTLHPAAKMVTLAGLPAGDQPTPFRDRLQTVVQEVKDGDSRVSINVEAVTECRFEDLTVNTGITQEAP